LIACGLCPQLNEIIGGAGLNSPALLFLGRRMAGPSPHEQAVWEQPREQAMRVAQQHNHRLRPTLIALPLIAATLGGCSTAALNFAAAGAPESEDAVYASSPANIASLTDVVRRNPGDPQAYNMRGSVFGQAGRHDEALADFNKAISIDAHYAQAFANRGLVYRETGKLALALSDYNKAIAIDHNYAVAYLGRGMVYRQQHKLFAALQDFDKAIALRPDNAQAYYNRGLLYQAKKQHGYAIDDFTTAIGLSTQQAEPYVARGLSYMAVKDYKNAASDLDQAVGIAPQSVQAWTSRGLAYERLGDKEKAAGSYARAMNIDQSYQPARAGFFRVGGRLGQAYQAF
jgi:tetratricopeptide (TPR) repeat protein